jgi:3-hydroxybutyryl-CoA dehydrogenase
MITGINKKEIVLVWGEDKVAYSIVVCLLRAGHSVELYTKDKGKAEGEIQMHIDDLASFLNEKVSVSSLVIVEELDYKRQYTLTIAITAECLKTKQAAVQEMERLVALNGIVAINTESIALKSIQVAGKNPSRIVGLNWVEPAHTTLFLEIICNEFNNGKWVDDFCAFAKENWQKDPYVARMGYSIRGRMMSALLREAFYLVENGYVTYEDVDRACRNDAGYYLPFAGNFRYMDLMGTYIYGLVMKDMNPDLCRERDVPETFSQLLLEGAKGMESKKGFYEYKKEDVENWNLLFRKFSYQISSLMKRYPEDRESLIGSEYKKEEAFR